MGDHLRIPHPPRPSRDEVRLVTSLQAVRDLFELERGALALAARQDRRLRTGMRSVVELAEREPVRPAWERTQLASAVAARTGDPSCFDDARAVGIPVKLVQMADDAAA